MRESEGGTLKHTLQYLYIGNTAQERPSHPSHLFGRSRETSLDFTRLPERFSYPINHHYHPYYYGQGYSFT